MKTAVLIASVLWWVGVVATGAKQLAISERHIRPWIQMDVLSVVAGTDGQEHVFTAGQTLLHFFRDRGAWQNEVLDGAYSAPPLIAAASSADSLQVIYHRAPAGLMLAYGATGAWQLESVPIGDPVVDSIAACSSGDDSLWLFFHEPGPHRVMALRRHAAVWDSEPLLIDEDGDCGAWMSAAGSPDGGFRLAYQAGNPYFDLRLACYDGESLTTETILEEGEQGKALSLAAAADGSLHLAAWDGYHNNLLYGTNKVDEGWIFTHPDAAWGCGTATSLAIGGDGFPAIAYFDADRRLAYAKWDGNDWSISSVTSVLQLPVTLQLAFEDSRPAIFSLTYFDVYHDNFSLTRSYDASGWKLDEIARASSFTNDLDLMFTSDGTPVILESTASDFILWQWENDRYVARVFYSGESKDREYLARGMIDEQNIIHIIGVLRESGYTPSVLEYWRIDHDQVLREPIFSDFGAWAGLSMGLDSAGTPHVLFAPDSKQYDYRFALKYASRTASGWEIENLLDDLSGDGTMELAIDRQDQAHIIYQEQPTWYNSILYYAYKNASGWSRMEIGEMYPFGTMHIVADHYGIPYIFFPVLDAYHCLELNGEEWLDSAADLSTTFEAPYTAMTFDADEQIALITLFPDYVSSSGISYPLLFSNNGLGWAAYEIGNPIMRDDVSVVGAATSPAGVLTAAYLGNGLTLAQVRQLPPKITLQLNAKVFHSGEPLQLDCVVTADQDGANYDVAVVFEAPGANGDQFYSWPGWQPIDEGLALTPVHLSANESITLPVLDVIWPPGAGVRHRLAFWAAILEPQSLTPQADLWHVYFSSE